jgi:transcription elongation GreA/GreB family factor
MTTKQKLLQYCNTYVEQRITDYKNEIELIKDAIESNQGSADDEEHGNAKLLNDLEKNTGYLNEAVKTHEYLKQVKTNLLSPNAALGSLVKTNSLHFFISISLGKIDLEDESYYAISLQSPIGQLLKQKTKGDTFEFKDHKYTVVDVI